MKINKMFILSIFIFLLSYSSVYCSGGFGLKGGINIDYYKFDPMLIMDYSITPRIAFLGGAFALIKFNDNFGIQTEIMYSQKGVNITDSQTYYDSYGYYIGSVRVEETVEMNYIDVPVLLKVYIPVGNIYPNFFVGPSFGFLQSANAKSKTIITYSDGTSQTENGDNDIKSQLLSFVNSIAVGVGVDIDLNGTFLTFDIKYTVDITDSSIKTHDRHNVLSASVGFAFGNYSDENKSNYNTRTKKPKVIEDDSENAESSSTADSNSIKGKENTKTELDAMTNKGTNAYNDEDYNEAIKCFKKALEYGQNSVLFIKLGDCYYKTQDPYRAIKYYKESIKLEPNVKLQEFITKLEKE